MGSGPDRSPSGTGDALPDAVTAEPAATDDTPADARQRQDGPRHKHEMVREYLLAMMDEELMPHHRLPTERELGDRLGVSRLTVRRALEELAAKGLVYRVQGSGTYVAEPAIRKGQVLTSFSEDMRSRGLTPSAKLLTAEEVLAGAAHSWKLGVSPGEPLWHLSRLRLADGVPMCIEDVHIRKQLAPDLLDHELGGSLYESLAGRYRITIDRAEQEVKATVLDTAEAELLGVPPLSPALLVERVSFDPAGRAVELARSVYRGDRYTLEIVLRRHHED